MSYSDPKITLLSYVDPNRSQTLWTLTVVYAQMMQIFVIILQSVIIFFILNCITSDKKKRSAYLNSISQITSI